MTNYDKYIQRIIELAPTHTKAEIARTLGTSDQVVSRAIDKEREVNDVKVVCKEVDRRGVKLTRPLTNIDSRLLARAWV